MRFIFIEGDSEFPNDGETCWYWDTKRPLKLKDGQPFIAVQCYCGIDPNDFVPIEGLRLLFTDQAEYYAVCSSCHFVYKYMQWSGSTRSPGWREQSQQYLEEHQRERGWCEFCDPVFGNGGWV